MSIGVFITTHISKNYRHGHEMESILFNRYKNIVIKSFQDYSKDNTKIYICDTGSTDKNYIDWSNSVISKNITKINIPNTGGCFAAMKYLMHNNPNLANKFDYILFYVDDDGFVKEQNWEEDLIEKYEKDNRVGIMSRLLDSIKIGPDGLVDHRNCCPHIAKIWGITKDTIIPHLHANWLFMSTKVLKDLSKVWYDPVNSLDAMEYQKKYENTNYCTLVDLHDNRKTLDNMHIGREVDLALRLSLIEKHYGSSYKGIVIYPNALEEYKHWINIDTPAKGFYGEYKYED